MTAGALFTLDVCQVGDFPACTMGLTTRWDHNRAAGAVPLTVDHCLRSPSMNVSQKEKVGLEGQFKREETGRNRAKVTFSENQEDDLATVIVNHRHLCDRTRLSLHVSFREDAAHKAASHVEGENCFCCHCSLFCTQESAYCKEV